MRNTFDDPYGDACACLRASQSKIHEQERGNTPQRKSEMNARLGRTRLVRLFGELGAQDAAKEALLDLR